ncbi:flagellar hook-associated protein FlgK [Natranaerofaba carboxydovora]|uniref:flagellar hook-associated protein FlgK n=1 Tax=Natranaerofaba carboxydovora TaxID=2742683 RepID=UPI001F1332D8|nr:flagellar hook-associated protein FlgK [Natranaerofaba carboxydovora]UMZ74996.1 Flagellar hook-associated protein 1 [Natranaerofaba carboxydovora]
MRSSFFGLETARRSLYSQKKALETTSHNIANANTEGYTRQKVRMSATNPYTKPAMNSPTGPGQIGTGVEVTDIERMRDDFIDQQIRNESRFAGDWSAKHDTLEKLEVIYNEPSESGLRDVFDQFWESLQTLADEPEDRTARSQVMERGVSLADTVNHMYTQMVDLKEDIDQRIGTKVSEINSIGRQIADLNKQIHNVELSQDKNANDLRDKRDVLLDELSELTDYELSEDSRGHLQVNIGGTALVRGEKANQMVFEEEDFDLADPGEEEDIGDLEEVEPEGSVVKWEHTGQEINFRDGEMKGLFDSRDEIVQDQINELRSVMYQFQDKFNDVHSEGFDYHEAQGEEGDSGDVEEFFNWLNNGDDLMEVDDDIRDDVFNIRAGYETEGEGKYPGNGENAKRLAQLKHERIIDEDYYEGKEDVDGTSTFNDFIDATVSSLGVEAQEAEKMVENQDLLLNQLKNRREAVSGVSLDEEMTDMIKYQQAYNAASRMVTAVDEQLDTIINRMGVVGR